MFQRWVNFLELSLLNYTEAIILSRSEKIHYSWRAEFYYGWMDVVSPCLEAFTFQLPGVGQAPHHAIIKQASGSLQLSVVFPTLGSIFGPKVWSGPRMTLALDARVGCILSFPADYAQFPEQREVVWLALLSLLSRNDSNKCTFHTKGFVVSSPVKPRSFPSRLQLNSL